jgi:hypothetical protein
MIQAGDIVKLRDGSDVVRITNTDGQISTCPVSETGIVVEIERTGLGGMGMRWVHVSWSWADGRIGRNFLSDLVKVEV